MEYKIFARDPGLEPFRQDIEQRMTNYQNKLLELVGPHGSLGDFANGHEYFGFHRTETGWVYREWAPAASRMWLTGDMVNWEKFHLEMQPLGGGVFELCLPGRDALYHGCRVKAILLHGAEVLERIPLYIRRVEQDKETYTWCGVIVDEPPYVWRHRPPQKPTAPRIYECHIGMATEREAIGTYEEFRKNILPRIKSLGYDTVQIMAIMEHPYYGSFGYQVSSFFAPCSRYGTPNELRALIDDAHGLGLTVLLDIVHSHAVKNTAEGLGAFDGTEYQFFHAGGRGEHPAWGTKLFNYNKNEVLHFLLSNLKYWLTDLGFDGFRFDGVTSMIYHDHGLGTAFGDYKSYFSLNTDTEAITYLQLANRLIREVSPSAITIAEDMSAMPGMCLPISEGGIGFDFRLAMGEPDMWIKLVRDVKDENWSMWHIWGELTGRRPGEKYIGYAESHDQALVGDKTLMFRLCDSEMYTHMANHMESHIIDRGMALHKMIRLATLTMGGEGYLNFMGNEFGHPEWIDFPREGNGWSYFYCRRQWSLAENDLLRYGALERFDRAMMVLCQKHPLFSAPPKCLFIDEDKQVLVFARGSLIFAFNFSPDRSYEGYHLTMPAPGRYGIALSTDDREFGGFGRVDTTCGYDTVTHADGTVTLPIYLPARTALCLRG